MGALLTKKVYYVIHKGDAIVCITKSQIKAEVSFRSLTTRNMMLSRVVVVSNHVVKQDVLLQNCYVSVSPPKAPATPHQ